MPRTKLPNRRTGITLSFVIGGLKYHGTANLTPDGSWGEIFLSAGLVGSDAHILARDLGIAVSLLFQYGCTIETIASALTRQPDGTPDGPLGVLLDKLIKED